MPRFLVMGLLLICLLALAGSSLQAGEHVVRIEQELSPEREEAVFNAAVRTEGFVRAVLEEVKAVLGSPLPRAREEAVLEVLSPRVQELVLSFSERSFVEEQSRAVLQLSVRVNSQAVKNLLQRWGTYYTSTGAWAYTLRAPGLDEKAYDAIRTLERMSGLNRAEKGDPVLELEQTGTSWRGELRFQDQAWKSEKRDLQELWPSLWSRYFRLDRIRSRVQVGLELQVSGWSSFTGLNDFDRRLRSWHQLLDRVMLQEVSLQGSGVTGRWLVRTLNEDALKGSLETFLSRRGLRFTMERIPGVQEPGASSAARTREASP